MNKAIIIVFVLFILSLAGGTVFFLINPNGIFDFYPEIVISGSDAETASVKIEFPFEQETVQGNVVLSLAPYNGAKAAEKTARLYGDSRDRNWMMNYYLAITNDPALEDLYMKLTGFFKSYAASHLFSDDEYIELLAAYAQNIPYKTIGDNTKFPIETVIENCGDCDDKSVLLAGLLNYAGFDSALFNYGTHVTAAIMADGEYVLIETTGAKYIGEVTEIDEVDFSMQPDVYKIGAGTKDYTVMNQVRTILQARDTLTNRIAGLKSEMSGLEKEMSAQMDLLEQSPNTSVALAYNVNVDRYNRYVDDYNAKVKLLNAIYTGASDRKGVYEKVKNIR